MRHYFVTSRHVPSPSVLYSNQGATTDLTFVQVLSQMRSILRSGRYSQVPQLTSSQKMDVTQQFYIVPPKCQGTKRAVLIGINYTGQVRLSFLSFVVILR